MNTTPYTWQIRISGRVQGVWFRAYTKQRADQLGVTGWVRNEADGSVTALIQHSDEVKLTRMLALLREGPPNARVDDCAVEVVQDPTQYEGFEIRR